MNCTVAFMPPCPIMSGLGQASAALQITLALFGPGPSGEMIFQFFLSPSCCRDIRYRRSMPRPRATGRNSQITMLPVHGTCGIASGNRLGLFRLFEQSVCTPPISRFFQSSSGVLGCRHLRRWDGTCLQKQLQCEPRETQILFSSVSNRSPRPPSVTPAHEQAEADREQAQGFASRPVSLEHS